MASWLIGPHEVVIEDNMNSGKNSEIFEFGYSFNLNCNLGSRIAIGGILGKTQKSV